MKTLMLLALSLVCTSIFAKPSSNAGFIEIRPGSRLYVEYFPAAPNRPTVLLVNGLSYSTRQWKYLVTALRALDPGVGIVTYDMQGMGKTLLENLDVRNQVLPVEQQSRDLHDLVRRLNIQGPISVAALSYGGAVETLHSTLYPDDFDNFIAIAPMIERLPEQDTLLKNYVNTHKALYPFDPRNDDELYDHYLRWWIYSTYPAAEPVMMENPYKLEAVFRMVQGVKNWNAFANATHMPKGKFHLIAAKQDEHVKISRLDEYWRTLPGDTKASYLRLDGSRHKIPEIWPNELAAWILQILNKNPHLKRGLTFDGDPVKKIATSGSVEIPLKKESFCEALLGTVP
jgi:pimeloyl-ACP methyl ester carboxylesterase